MPVTKGRLGLPKPSQRFCIQSRQQPMMSSGDSHLNGYRLRFVYVYAYMCAYVHAQNIKLTGIQKRFFVCIENEEGKGGKTVFDILDLP